MAQDMTYALEEREQYKEAIARIDMDKEYYPQMLMKYTSEEVRTTWQLHGQTLPTLLMLTGVCG